MSVGLAWPGLGAAAPPAADTAIARHGRGVRLSHEIGEAGAWTRLTFRGVRGLTAGLAPGRFAAALHLPPAAGAGRFGWRRSALRHGLPGLDDRLAEVFATCSGVEAAVDRLAAAPVAVPALLVLASAGPSGGAVLDWSDGFLAVHRAPVCLGMPGSDGPGAAVLGRTRLAAVAGGVAWLHARVEGTRRHRIAVAVNAASGQVTIQTIHADRATTATLRLPA